MKTKILHYLKVWIPFAATVSLMSCMAYGTVHQNFRQSANDPQIQIAEDVYSALANGANPTQLNQGNKVDISKSLSTYIIIYDKDGAPVASTGILDNNVPKLPSGVLDYVSKHGEDRITWEPKSGVRSAIVVRSYSSGDSSGFLLVGRSLREIEKRTAILGWHVLAGWVVSLFVTLFSIIFVDLLLRWLHRPAPVHHEPEQPVDL